MQRFEVLGEWGGAGEMHIGMAATDLAGLERLAAAAGAS